MDFVDFSLREPSNTDVTLLPEMLLLEVSLNNTVIYRSLLRGANIFVVEGLQVSLFA